MSVQKHDKIYIRGFLKLRENWDSYGAYTIKADTVKRAEEFYDNLPLLGEKFTDPRICPVCNGEIHFNWIFNKKRVMVCIPIENEGTNRLYISKRKSKPIKIIK